MPPLHYLDDFDDEERNLTFVKMGFQVLKINLLSSNLSRLLSTSRTILRDRDNKKKFDHFFVMLQ